MSASGKSSNRHGERRRAASTGSGHGIYAAEGIREYQRNQARRAATAHRAAPAPKVAKPSDPTPWSVLGVGFIIVLAAERLARRKDY